MSTIVLGNGFLGSHLVEKFKWDNIRSRDILKEAVFIPDALEAHKPSVIVNTIAQTDTRKCERLEDNSVYLNSILPHALQNYCNKRNILLVHISTACLYNTDNVICKENSTPRPQTNYTFQKLVGEPPGALILRPRLVFGDTTHDSNLLHKMRNFTCFRKEKNSFTSMETLCNAIKNLSAKGVTGIFNICDDGVYSLCDLAKSAGLQNNCVEDVGEKYKAPSLVLSNEKMKTYGCISGNTRDLFIISNNNYEKHLSLL
jgi:dTDP-4-dehydrorhamnose reductase